MVPKFMRPPACNGVFLVGPRRTGSFPHQDPNATAAWNWLVHGRKRWCLFPPHIAESTVLGPLAKCEGGNEEDGGEGGGEGEASDVEDAADSTTERNGEGGGDQYQALMANTAAYWWKWTYPELLSRGAELGMVECIQEPGDVIYVPQGWWHAVINISPWTVAVTHNVVLLPALPSAFTMVASKDPQYAARWRKCLHAFAPDVAAALEKKIPRVIAAISSAALAKEGKSCGGETDDVERVFFDGLI